MADDRAVDVLNDLLAAEYQNTLAALRTADPWVSLATSDDQAVFTRIQGDMEDNERALFETILSLRGAPVSRRISANVAAAHYVKLSHLTPMLIADLKRLVAAYESAAGTTGNARAEGVISNCLKSYRRGLADLERVHGQFAGAGR